MRIVRARGSAILFVVTAAFVAACSGSAGPTGIPAPASAVGGPVVSAQPGVSAGVTAPSGAATGTDPCKLVTPADAQAALGVPVGAPQRSDNGVATVCSYPSTDGQRTLEATTTDGGADKASFDAVMQFQAGQNVAVPGVGSEAFFNANDAILSVWQNNLYLTIHIIDTTRVMTTAQVQAATTKVAIAALARV